MKDFIKDILFQHFPNNYLYIYENSPLIKYLDLKMGAVYGNSKTRRNLGNIYAIYSILFCYNQNFFNNPEEYRNFEGYEFTLLFNFCRSLYGGNKLQNHALNSRVNGEFKNKIVKENDNDLIIINSGNYLLHIDYLYVNDTNNLSYDISRVAIEIIQKYIELLKEKDSQLIKKLEELMSIGIYPFKRIKISELLTENAEARIFEIISYAILKNHYKNTKIYIGYSPDQLEEQYLTLYKTGRTNANDGGIDFVMRPLGRFFQVTEVNDYGKYLLDIDKVLHFPITFVIKTEKHRFVIQSEINNYINFRASGMKVIQKRYIQAIEEIITINELKDWLNNLDNEAIDQLIKDIDFYYKLELNIL
jgi:hypothetical protein